MKYLIFSTLLLALVARADDLLPEGTQVEAEPALSEPVPPSLALPVEAPTIATATAISTATELAPLAPAQPMELALPAQEPAGNFPYEAPAESAVPVDITAQQPIPPPVATPQIDYGPSAEEGYGSVGLKNEGQFMEVGRDKKTEEILEEGDRKTSSLPEETDSSQ